MVASRRIVITAPGIDMVAWVNQATSRSRSCVHTLRAPRSPVRPRAETRLLLGEYRFATHTPAIVISGDATSLPLGDQTVDAIVTSPPYWKMYDYFDVHRLTYLAFAWRRHSLAQIGQFYGIERDGVGFMPPRYMRTWYRRDFRAEGSVPGRSLRHYWNNMRLHICEAKRVLQPGGLAAYAVANHLRSQRRFALAQALMSVFREFGFKDVKMRARNQSSRRILPLRRDECTGRFSSDDSNASVAEFIIYARR